MGSMPIRRTMKLEDYVDYVSMFFYLYSKMKKEGKLTQNLINLKKELDWGEEVEGATYHFHERNGNIVTLHFSEIGDASESYSQGWTRDYFVTFDYVKEIIINCEYQQG